MYKIGVIGDRDSVYGFGALVLDVFPAQTGEQAAELLRKLAEDGHGVLYVTAGLCAGMEVEL